MFYGLETVCLSRWGLFDGVLGTTWVSYILDLLYFGEMPSQRQTTIPIYERVPFMEMFIPSIISG